MKTPAYLSRFENAKSTLCMSGFASREVARDIRTLVAALEKIIQVDNGGIDSRIAVDALKKAGYR